MANLAGIEGTTTARANQPRRGAEGGAEDGAFALLLGQNGARDDGARHHGASERAEASGRAADRPAKAEGRPQGAHPAGVRATAGDRHGGPGDAGKSGSSETGAANRLSQLAAQLARAEDTNSAQGRLAAAAAKQIQALVQARQAAGSADPQQTAAQQRPEKGDASAKASDDRLAGQRISVTTGHGESGSRAASPVSAETSFAALAAGQDGAGRRTAESALARGAAEKTEGRGQGHGHFDPATAGQGDGKRSDSSRSNAQSGASVSHAQAMAQHRAGDTASGEGQDHRQGDARDTLDRAAARDAHGADTHGRHPGSNTFSNPGPTTASADLASQPASNQPSQPQGQGQSLDPVLQGTSGGGSGSQETEAAQRPANAQAHGRPMPGQAVPDQIAVQIQRAIGDGQQRVTIRLHPAELGRIDVKLDLGRDGSVRAMLAVDRPETLDLLQRDARALEKALNDAGLKTDNGSLSFDLRGEGNQDHDPPPGEGSGGETALSAQEAGADGRAGDDGHVRSDSPPTLSAGRIDIRI